MENFNLKSYLIAQNQRQGSLFYDSRFTCLRFFQSRASTYYYNLYIPAMGPAGHPSDQGIFSLRQDMEEHLNTCPWDCSYVSLLIILFSDTHILSLGIGMYQVRAKSCQSESSLPHLDSVACLSSNPVGATSVRVRSEDYGIRKGGGYQLSWQFDLFKKRNQRLKPLK